jgi:phosphoserine phosphatase
MRTIVCLIADPGQHELSEREVAAVARALRGERRWLAAGIAAEIGCERDPDEAGAMAREALGGLPLDVVALPSAGRRKRLLLSDMDSTVITVECIDELADFAGIRAEVAAVTRRAMNGEIDFATSLRERVALLAGLPERILAEVCAGRIRPAPGAASLVATMRAAGARCVLVSGGFSVFTRFVRERLGFDADEANELEIADGRLTGRLIGPLRDAESKRSALHRHAAALGLDAAAAVAVGDGANDLPMLLDAGMGIAYHAHPRVRAAAPFRIDHADLRALLYLQGFATEAILG